MIRSTKHIISGALIAISIAAFSVPERSYAVPASIIADPWTAVQTIAVRIGNAFQSVSSFANAALQQKELVLDGVASAALSAVRTSLVRSVLDWANSGFNGKPAFVQDLNRTLDDIADQTAERFIKGNGLSALCAPFALQVKGALALNYKEQRGSGTQIQRCTFDTISKNIENFGKSVDRAREMTFADFFNYTSNPVNSPQGAYLDAKAKMGVAIVNNKGEKLAYLGFGDGFLSKEECFPTDETGANFDCQVITPGDTISASINKSLGLGADALVSADEINEFVSAAISTVMQNVLSKGLSGYNPNTAPSGNYGYAQTDIAYSSTVGVTVDSILPTQQVAEDQFISAYTLIENSCHEPLMLFDGFDNPIIPTEAQKAAYRLQQLQENGVYELLLDAQARAEAASVGYNELLTLKGRASAARTSAESIAVTQELASLSTAPYIYMHNEDSSAYLLNVQSQVSGRCDGPDSFGGGGS